MGTYDDWKASDIKDESPNGGESDYCEVCGSVECEAANHEEPPQEPPEDVCSICHSSGNCNC